MMVYLLMGLMFSGFYSAEFIVASLPALSGLRVDAVLPVVLFCAARGRGRSMVAAACLAGWLRAAQAGAPAGWYVLAYLLPALLLHGSRSWFFLDRAPAQGGLTFFLGLLSVMILWGGAMAGSLSSPFDGGVFTALVSCLATAGIAPLLFRLSAAVRLGGRGDRP